MTTQKQIVAAIGRIETALNAAARSQQIPDYSGLHEKIGSQLIKERAAGAAGLHGDPGPTTIAAITLLGRYKERAKSGAFNPVNFRRFKLLYSVFTGSARGKEMVSTIFKDARPTDLTLDADEITPAELRMRLIIAAGKGDFDDANFLLGHLNEEDHDPGERNFLKALVAYASGKPARTIKLVEGIPHDAIDRPKGAWMATKAAALLGDRMALDNLLDEIEGRISTFGWMHLIELLGRSVESEDYPSFRARLPQPLVASVNDPSYEEWAILHVQMMRAFLARLREMNAASEATGELPSEDEIAADVVLGEANAALFVEHIMKRETNAKTLVELLEPMIAKGSVSAFRVCVETLLDAGEVDVLVKYAKRFPHSPLLPWYRDLDIVGAIYMAATLSGDRVARRLQRLLPIGRLESLGGATKRMEIASRLTPMGRISFLSAAGALDGVLATNDRWRDCGLISLALFRAIEVEINARVVRPLANRLDVATLRSPLPPKSALGSALKALREATAPGNGLMFGPLRIVLKQLRPDSSDDHATSDVRRRVRKEFDGLMSSTTDKDGGLAQLDGMVSSELVRRYRNPPAHGEFLRLEEADAALKHVLTALDRLTTLFPNRST